jgi:hypothetical protein
MGVSYRVTAPYVVAKVNTQQGPQMAGLHTGSLVPPEVSPEWIAHHLRKKMIEEVPAPTVRAEKAVRAPAGGADDPPGGQGQTPPAGQDAEPSTVTVKPDPGAGEGTGKAVNARSTKADLVDHGVAQGADRAELEAQTRDQLLDRYVRPAQP